jgi:hypothetical protein
MGKSPFQAFHLFHCSKRKTVQCCTIGVNEGKSKLLAGRRLSNAARGDIFANMFDQASQDKACELIADGVSLRQVAKELGLSHASIFSEVAAKDPHFCKQYARAMDDRSDNMVDQIIDIADNDKLDPNDKRIRVDARKWIASKLRPKKYGDRIQSDVDLNVKVTLVNPFQIAQDAVQAALTPAPMLDKPDNG